MCCRINIKGKRRREVKVEHISFGEIEIKFVKFFTLLCFIIYNLIIQTENSGAGQEKRKKITTAVNLL